METGGLSRQRRWLFTAFMLLLPVLFFLILEGGLRVAGYGAPLPLFKPVEEKPAYLYQNREVARRYFYHQQSVPSSLLDFFSAQKDSSAFRIFVQGGSSAAGYPFYYGGAFSRMLQQRLQRTFPEKRVEVINTAMAAVNSYTLLDFADEIIAQQPDAVLIYTGHNEYYGALGVGSAESLGRNPTFVRLYLRLQRLRTVQLLRNIVMHVASLGARPGAERGGTLMARIVREQTIPYGSPLFNSGMEQFASNLDVLLARYRRAGIPVFIGTVVSNERDQPPFVSVQEASHAARWETRLAQAWQRYQTGGHAGLDSLRALVAADSLDAMSRYRLAQALEATGDTAAARQYYGEARDRDALRFRAPERVNAIIREQAAAHGAFVIPVAEALRARSPGGIIGHEMMLEHLHPTVDGYFLIADAFYNALHRQEAGGTWRAPVLATAAREDLLLTPVDSLVGMYRVIQLKASWPFQPVGVTLPYLDTLQARSPSEEIALRLFKGDITWTEANAAQRDYFVSQGNLKRAAQAALAASQEYLFDENRFLEAGNLLMAAGQYPEALLLFQQANRLGETSTGRGMEGAILLQMGQVDPAITALEKALALDDANVQARYNLAGAYARRQRFADALKTIEDVLVRRADYPGARALRDQLIVLAR